MQVYQAVEQLFRLEGGLHKSLAATAKGPASANVAIVPCQISNSLVISGPPEAVEEVLGLLDKMDRVGGMLLLEMEMGVVPVGEAKHAESPKPKDKSPTAKAEPYRLLERPAKMETTGYVRLVTLDNQPGYVQMGLRVPHVTGVSVSAKWRGGEVNFHAKRGPDPCRHSAHQFRRDGHNADRCRAIPTGAGNEGIPIAAVGNKVVREPRVDAAIVQTTVRIPNAQSVILAASCDKANPTKNWWL